LRRFGYSPWLKKTENRVLFTDHDTLASYILATNTYSMFLVYVLYSVNGKKGYTGLTNDVERRLFEHNVSETSGYSLRYRPWTLIRQEQYLTKQEAMRREKFLKTGRGRMEIKSFVDSFLKNDGAVSATAEKD